MWSKSRNSLSQILEFLLTHCSTISLSQVIEFFSGTHLDKRIYVLCLFPIVCALGNLTNLRYLAPFSTLGFIFIFIGICSSIYYFFYDIPDPGRLNKFTKVLPVPMYGSMFLFAMHNTTYCLPLENSMENPQKLPGFLTVSMLFNMVTYMVFGFLGYNKYGEAACDTVIKNLPMEET